MFKNVTNDHVVSKAVFRVTKKIRKKHTLFLFKWDINK